MAGLILVVRAGRYDYFGDELYFLAAGRRLSTGYVDQGPLLPIVARLMDAIAPGSIVALRLPAIMLGIAGIALAAALAREFGGGRGAQLLAGLGYASCPFLVTQAATLSTFAFDATLSAVMVWLLLVWIRTHRDGVLLVAALVAALDSEVKLLIPVLLAGIGLGVIVFGPRAMLGRPALWLGVLIVAAAAAPGLWWQAAHGWPQLDMGTVIRSEQFAAAGGPATVPIQLATLAGVLGSVLALWGLWGVVRYPWWREYRFLVVAVAAQIGFVLVSGGRPYYLAGLLPVLFAAGAVGVSACDLRRWWRGVGIAVVAMAVTIAVVLTVLLPLPTSRLHNPTRTPHEQSTRMRIFGTTGWSELVAAVRAADARLDPSERRRTVIVAQTYWQAAAVDRLGGADLPAVYSPNRGFAFFGTPPDSATTVLYITAGAAEPALRPLFSQVEPVARVDDPLGFPGISSRVTVWKCLGPTSNWSELWRTRTTSVLDPGL
ncbi:glycosyltransferase family 39 protein [Nocardia sp. CA-129566]|uniref:glycosyltransferase family 39 protein n=1 Tax=Nocardia sp. CA-129566 TaxID=3239976 RepID=UPI003D985A1E